MNLKFFFRLLHEHNLQKSIKNDVENENNLQINFCVKQKKNILSSKTFLEKCIPFCQCIFFRCKFNTPYLYIDSPVLQSDKKKILKNLFLF